MRKQDNLPCLLCYNIFIVKSLHMLFRIFSNQFSCIVILTQNLDLVIKNVYHLLFRLCEIHVLLLFLIHQSFIHESKLLPWPTQFRFISNLSQNLGHLDIRLRNLLLLCRVFPLYIKMWCLFLNSDVTELRGRILLFFEKPSIFQSETNLLKFISKFLKCKLLMMFQKG